MKMQKLWILSGLALLVVGGCADNSVSRLKAMPQGQVRGVEDPEIAAEAGTPILGAEAQAGDVKTLADSMYFGMRSNPFALLMAEAVFDKNQLGYSVINNAGGWSVYFEEPELPPVEDEIPVEPIPVWRLSGVLIGDGVTAILDMGNQTIQIRPGMTIPGTNWTVVSIDEERAILRRPGEEPNEMAVPLGGPLSGLPGGGGTTGGGTTGGRGPSTPGNRSGGRPGGPPAPGGGRDDN